jgi:hypothetical protein
MAITTLARYDTGDGVCGPHALTKLGCCYIFGGL